MNTPHNPLPTPAAYSFGDLAIAGRWRAGRALTTLQVRDPFNGQALTEIAEANLTDVDEAFEAAAAAQPGWAETLPTLRADVMRRVAQLMELRREEIVRWLIRESGSTRIKAEMEWGTVRAIVLEASTLPSRAHGRILQGDFPGKENRIYRKPVGVVAVISPWNWPLHLSARSVVPALALGNVVVTKPANETPITGGLLLARLLEEAGLPQGVLNVVVGPSSAIGDAFVQHPASRVVSFTGSTGVGRRIGQMAISGPRIKKAMLEFGGNGPLVVLDDADLDMAAHIAAVGRFLHQGQICMSANRIVVMDAVHDAFMARFIERVRQLKVGDPNDADTAIGPVINRKQMDKLLAMVDAAKAAGARQVLGGAPQGLVLPPQVFDGVSPDMALARTEIFGPIAPVIRARDEEEALRMANDTDAGLSSAVITRDAARGLRFAQRIEAGMTHINDAPTIDMPTMPFGGEKNSGLGRFGAEGVIDAFTTEHWISVQHSTPLYPF
jgi:aldehyde dehydrogenase (NAD+)